jgi:hypothetical protein
MLRDKNHDKELSDLTTSLSDLTTSKQLKLLVSSFSFGTQARQT